MKKDVIQKLLDANLACDVTPYARSLGYDGVNPVVVSGGQIISHNNKDWFLFCDDLRQQKKDQEHSANIPPTQPTSFPVSKFPC